MALLAWRSADDVESTLREAKEAAALYLTDGTMTMELGWFWPHAYYLASHTNPANLPGQGVRALLRAAV
jgi:hypothetical protein